MKRLLLALLFTTLPCLQARADAYGQPTPPRDRPLRVAFVISPYATVIDFAGPWEVFQDVDTGDQPGIQLYTVSASRTPIQTSGSGGHGLTITPDYSFADAPEPDLVVIGAQQGAEGLTAWLKKVNADQHIIMSVCTGAFKLAATGLLDDKPATTHHDFFDRFSTQFPKV